MENKEQQFCYKYPHPAVTTDCVIFGFDGVGLNVLLIERGIEPYKGKWAFPGGFLNMTETAEQGALRELREETNVTDVFVEQLQAFTDVERDPRERVITIAFYALVRPSDYEVLGGDDAKQARWFPIDDVPPLAFDHDRILRCALKRLKQKIHFEPIGFRLLDTTFTVAQLQRLYEAILEISFDRRNFYRKIMSLGILVPQGEEDTSAAHRKAQLFSFDEKKYNLLKEQGMKLEF